MSSAVATTLWARAFVDELARGGVRDVVVAPGSRSTPLVLAFAEHGRFRMRVHLDERSGAFFALGAGKASRRPAALVTTSGTAAANVLPAVVEAAQSETPLLVLTADRPHRLRGSDANQTVHQIELYGSFAKVFHEVSPPVLGGSELRHLRSVAARAVLDALEVPRGPVHVNLPFDKPLEPQSGPEIEAFSQAHPLAAAGRPGGLPFVRTVPGRRAPREDGVAFLVGLMRSAPQGVIVAGPSPDPADMGAAVLRLAEATGYPVLADPLSGARFRAGAGTHVVEGYDLFLRDAAVRDAFGPELVIRVGASPTSAAVQGWLEHHNGARHVVVDDGRRWKDHGAVATDYLRCDPGRLLGRVAADVTRCVGDAWRESWVRASHAARNTLAHDRGQPEHEGRVVAGVAAALPRGAALFVSSSMPIRDLDAFGQPRDDVVHVFGNRGASGIDGIVSTAFGVASAAAGPTVCVLGDVALFHDLNGLLWIREDDVNVVFVLIDNDGGAIFHMLPVREHEPHFSRFFAAPHGLDFRHAAELHGATLTDVEADGVESALEAALATGRTTILRVRTDRDANHRRHQEVADAVIRDVLAALEPAYDPLSPKDR